ncbi:ABC transporter ATPase [Staphylococcus gallinarum]|uniref:ABC transporter ATPase n=1 Tax=Staphylococcus gallinarum TaxID=1293 RepID=A0A380FEV8_STAGA|nr:ABC transporter ATPase [Staphylococcus gallinarum]
MFIFSILLAITVVIQNVSIAEILNRLLLKTNQDVVVIITITLFILLARATFNTLNQLMGDRLAQVVKYDLRQQLISKQSVAPIGAQLNTLTQNIDGITSFFNGYLPQVFKIYDDSNLYYCGDVLYPFKYCINNDCYRTIYSFVLHHFRFKNAG